jgi:hypothetical protein
MQIKVHYPVHATGTPKGMRNERKVYGSVFDFFEVPEVDEDLLPFVTVKPTDYYGKLLKDIEYFSAADGGCYRKFSMSKHNGFNELLAWYGDENSPVSSSALVQHATYFRGSPSVDAEYFPQNLRSSCNSGHGLTSLDPKSIKDLEIKQDETEMANLRQAVRELIIVNGELYKRVPEPVFAVTVDESRRVNTLNWITSGFAEFEAKIHSERDNFRKKREVVGFFALTDKDRALDFAAEITAKVGGTNQTDPDAKLDFDTFGQPMSGTTYNLKVLSQRMHRSAVESISTGDLYGTADYAKRILSWSGQTLEAFRKLDAAQASSNWTTDGAGLEKVVIECLEHDAAADRKVFTNPFKGQAYSFYDEVWQEYQMAAMMSDTLAP